MLKMSKVNRIFDAIVDDDQENLRTMALAGSSVLKYFDLIDREISDVDILVNKDNSKLVDFVKKLSKLFPVKDKDGYYYYDKKENHVRFMLFGEKVCVFIVSDIEFFDSTRYVPSAEKRFATIESIMFAKQTYIKNSNPKSSSYVKHFNDITKFHYEKDKLVDHINKQIAKLKFISPISVKFDIKK